MRVGGKLNLGGVVSCDKEHDVDPALLGEPRCSWHIGNGLSGEGLNVARAAKRARSKL